jgi:tagatose-6-phosphate ketose/aldose isomerase
MNSTHYTYSEIRQQPAIWKTVYNLIKSQKNEITSFLDKVFFDDKAVEIIITGAGSSFFVAETSAVIFQKNTGFTVKAVSSTELVTHPDLYINKGKNNLLISLARSGNSPESTAAIVNAELVSETISHLIITCNKTGKLATDRNENNSYAIILPEETNDKGLAMTSSVSSMILASLLVSNIKDIENLSGIIHKMADFGEFLLNDYSSKLKDFAANKFSRAVFLGSGASVGIAREGHLKLQELTDGKIICTFDSFLGFRHGPKAVVNNETLMVYLMSNNEYVRKYEKDLVNSVQNEQKPNYSIIISESFESFQNISLTISMKTTESSLPEEILSICSLIPIQLLAYYKSLEYGLNPDSPSERGAIHRVVQGVSIYPYKKLLKTNTNA